MYKFLIANVMFRLPDDFSGNLSDALRAAADYIDQKETGSTIWHESEEMNEVNLGVVWEQFLTAHIETEGRKNLYVIGEIAELDENGKWSYPRRGGGKQA